MGEEGSRIGHMLPLLQVMIPHFHMHTFGCLGSYYCHIIETMYVQDRNQFLTGWAHLEKQQRYVFVNHHIHA